MLKMKEKPKVAAVMEKIVTVFVLGYGLHYLGYFLRVRYFNFLEATVSDEAVNHILGYLGHTIFLIIMLLYAWAVRKDRKYILSFSSGKLSRNLLFALYGAVIGFAMMGICIFAASAHGDIVIGKSGGLSVPLILFALFAVFIQASVEEIESRAFVFGKMKNEGVPIVWATVVSAFFFSYLHAANPGFGLLPLLSIFIVGILYALSYHYFGTIWFTCTAHMMWNFTQDFIFGLPDSGKPAALSVFSTTVTGSSFFYDESFGIEGSWMAILVNLLACVLVFLIGRKVNKQRQ
jgi:hypothetical protein